MRRSAILALIVLLPLLAGEARAQRRARAETSAQLEGTVVITIAGKISGKKYQASGDGTCRHAPDATIRGASASLWMVQFSGSRDGDLSQLNLTLWRPKDEGPDQLSLSMETKSGSHRVQTGGEGENQGEGAVTILPNGPGGRLEITGKDARGKPIQITIDCPAFSAVEAEGG